MPEKLILKIHWDSEIQGLANGKNKQHRSGTRNIYEHNNIMSGRNNKQQEKQREGNKLSRKRKAADVSDTSKKGEEIPTKQNINVKKRKKR